MDKEEKLFPERSCVICRVKNKKEKLLRLAKTKVENFYAFDKNQNKQTRGAYICKSLTCLGKLQKHNRYKLNSEDLIEMLNLIKKDERNYINILSSMKNSGELVFGINLLFENIGKVHFIILANDISKKNYDKILKKSIELKIPYISVENKKNLGKIFGKDEVNVIGITNKKMAKGLTG